MVIVNICCFKGKIIKLLLRTICKILDLIFFFLRHTNILTVFLLQMSKSLQLSLSNFVLQPWYITVIFLLFLSSLSFFDNNSTINFHSPTHFLVILLNVTITNPHNLVNFTTISFIFVDIHSYFCLTILIFIPHECQDC